MKDGDDDTHDDDTHDDDTHDDDTHDDDTHHDTHHDTHATHDNTTHHTQHTHDPRISHLASARYLREQAECHLSLGSLGAAQQTLEKALALLSDHCAVPPSPRVTPASPSPAKLWLECALLLSETLARSLLLEDDLQLLQSIPDDQNGYLAPLLRFHRARCLFCLSLQQARSGFFAFAQTCLQQADDHCNQGLQVRFFPRFSHSCSACRKHFFSSKPAFSDRNESLPPTSDVTPPPRHQLVPADPSLDRELRLVDQRRIFLDPANVALWFSLLFLPT